MSLISKLRSLSSRPVSSGDEDRSNMYSSLSRIKKLGFSPKTIFDVGVGNGTEDLYSIFPTSYLYLLEPLKEFEKGIKSILKKYNGGYTIAASGALNGNHTINVHDNHLEGSSLLSESTPTIGDGNPRQIPIVTLDHITRENKLRGPFLIKVDAQGYELEVIKGSHSILPQTEVIILEVLLYKFLTNNPIFHEIISHMHNLSFVCYDIIGLSYRPKDDALAHCDLVFVKHNGIFRQSNDWE